MKYRILTDGDFKEIPFFQEKRLPKMESIMINNGSIEIFTAPSEKSNELERILSEYLKAPVKVHTFDFNDKVSLFKDRLINQVKLLNGVLDDVKIEGKVVKIFVSNDFVKERISVNGSKHAIDELVSEFFPSMKVEIFCSKKGSLSEPKPAEMMSPPPIENGETAQRSKTGRKKTHKNVKVSLIKSLQNSGKAWIAGETFGLDFRNGKTAVLSFSLKDPSSAISCRAFGKMATDFSKAMPKYALVSGKISEDKFSHEKIMLVDSIEEWKPEFRKDEFPKKRVELHLHTTMSSMDGLVNVDELFETLKQWGHKAIAVTDHGVIQSFPAFEKASKKTGIKALYGMEAYVVDDTGEILRNGNVEGEVKNHSFVVVDFETTGLNAIDDEIIEIGAVKIENLKVVDKFHSLIKPTKEISDKSLEITGISLEDVENAPSIEEVLPKLLDFIRDSIFVAHNADFDYRFLRESAKRLGIEVNTPYIDTLQFSKSLLKLSGYGLEKVVKALNLGTFNHHRALDDTMVTAEVFLKLTDMAASKGIHTLEKLNELSKNVDIKSLYPYHMTILVKDKNGLKNLYKLVSKSHLEYFKGKPRIPKSLLQKRRKGLLIGSACTAGELAENYFGGASNDELISIASFYDFLEIMPLDVLSDDNSREITKELLKKFYLKVYSLGKALSIPVVMTGDVHFLNPEDAKVRAILQAAQDYKNFNSQGGLYLRTTQEMLDEARKIFSDSEFADDLDKVCEEVVIENTNKIADEIEELKIVDSELHPPKIDNAEETIKNQAYQEAKRRYGDPLPKAVEERLERELHSIIGNGYAVLYLIAKELVEKSKSDGYVVGSRGSVGSSLVATMLGITEVNPLPPHYYCPECHYFEFDNSVESGYDLPEKACPKCGAPLKIDGQNIPFETFMGFHGDKVPDIDLNFSGDYQSKAHKFIETLFGKRHVFRAGTISTIAERTAYGFVKGYIEKTGENLNKAEIEYLASKLTGVKRTTGQHPGGLMIVPKDMDIHSFTPIQRPANDTKSDVTTTHFDYHSIHDTLVKLDILGHDDPTTMRMLKDLTGIDPMNIPMNDKKTLGIFSSTKPLGVTKKQIGTEVGTYGIPEFGTRFVRQMLVETKPKTFGDLVRISGLSHGTDVWANNAQNIIKSGKATLEEVIACRDDIMNYLITKGVDPSMSFKIMEKVRKGKKLEEEDLNIMKEKGVPAWYVNSCKKIKYLFPKAHAVAYVSMAFRIAYFKVHHPLAFYATYLTIKGGEFDIKVVKGGLEWVNLELQRLAREGAANVKEKAKQSVLEICREMMIRGFGFKNVDIFKSSATKFTIEDKDLRVPLNKVPGLGEKVAASIEAERKKKMFRSVEDLRKRTLINKTHLKILRELGALKDLPENDQITLM
ncbi:PolC-type DNA polymerase III [Mesoaciditoga lauensis]|uniref:PolC-type DNA polymerase III n=1 Tax=Mesoaciditoga lauensis TaxID=1495039 RepID=UPI00055C4F46|nr:PolC-type DNA polymerase III [Mesoaciditoga lauensis]